MRMHQLFAAPSGAPSPGQAAPSPWISDGRAYLPLEHWFAIIDFTRAQGLDEDDLLERASQLGPPAGRAGRLEEWVHRLVSLLETVAEGVLHVPPLVPEPSEAIPENFENSEHAAMLRSVRAVVESAIESGEMFFSWRE